MNAPNVHIDPDVERRIRELAAESRDGRETGGILLGRGPNPNGVIRVERAGDPGPAAQRRPDFFLRDLAHARELAQAAWQESNAVWVGEWHTHPAGPCRPSVRDFTTYTALLSDPDLAFRAFVSIIVLSDTDWREPRLLVWVLGSSAACWGEG